MSQSIRPATEADYPDFARLFVELRTGDAVPALDIWRDHLAPGSLVIDDGGRTIAYAYSAPYGDIAHVINVVVAPEAQGRGVGRTLMAAVARRLRGEGCTRWALNVKPDNEPAVRLYRRFGFTPAHEVWSLRLPHEAIARLPRALDAAPRLVEPHEDGALAAEFGFPAGQAAARRAHGRVLLGVPGASAGAPWRAFAAFDPRLPGAMPFRAHDAGIARALLEAIRDHALPEHDYLLLAIERDRALLDALVGAGGELRFEMLHMTGTIPDLAR